jgi:Protein of unknown function (DUF2637)
VPSERGQGLTGLAVLAVAVVAGIVSFSHIEGLALAHGYMLGTAHLLPVSVDGLIVAASLACLTEARARGEASRLARVGLVLGILATLAANVAAGAQYGAVDAVVNAWPAIAFIVASEILLRMLRAARGVPSTGEHAETAAMIPTAPVSTQETVADAVPEVVPVDVPADVPASTVPPVPEKRLRTVASGGAPKRAPSSGSKAPERIFAAEIEAGELPSLREVKRRAACGTPRAKAILVELGEVLAAQSLTEVTRDAA